MCEADDCDKPKHGLKPYCRMHLARLKRTGTLGGFKEIHNYDKVCKTEGCNEKYTQKNSQLCDLHYVDYRKQVDAERTSRLELYSWLMNPKIAGEIDYDDLWKWVEKEMAA